MFCWLHAHNMLTQDVNMHPQRVVTSLDSETRDPHCIGRDNIILSYRDRGPFGVMAINRYLFKHAQQKVYYKMAVREAQTMDGLDEEQFKALLPPGTKGACIAFEPTGYAQGHMKCIRYIERDAAWYALDSMVPPYITPLTTTDRWKAHTTRAEIYVLMGTTHFQGPSMGAYQPRLSPPPGPEIEQPYDIDEKLCIHSNSIRRVDMLYTTQELREYCPTSAPPPPPHPPQTAIPDPSSCPRADQLETELILDRMVLPQQNHPAPPPIKDKPLNPRNPLRTVPRGTTSTRRQRQHTGSVDIRQFFKVLPPSPKRPKLMVGIRRPHMSLATDLACPPTAVTAHPPRREAQDPIRISHKSQKPSRSSSTRAKWKRIAARKKSTKKIYRKIKHSASTALYSMTRSPPHEHMMGCKPSEEKIKIVTINGRGLKTKISILRMVLGVKPDIIVWTEHQMAKATTIPRWTQILLQGYRWGYTSLPKIKGQAGVLVAIHKDLLAGTNVHIPVQPPETQGYIYQMELQRPESAPLMITGVYLPTGKGAHLSRPTLYQHLQSSMARTDTHVHIVAGDMNAALYKTDRDPGRKGSNDSAYRAFVQENGLKPLDPPNPLLPGAQRARTFRRGADSIGEDVSRIDDILMKGIVETMPGASTYLIDTHDLNTDHHALCAEIPYTTLHQLPLPTIEGNTATSRKLSLPMTPEDKRILTQTIEERQILPIRSLWQDLRHVLETQVHPYWERLEKGTTRPTDPKWAPQQQLQAEINVLGDRMTAIFQQALSTALEVCTTVTQAPKSSEHHQKRSTARQRAKLIKMRHRIRDIRQGIITSPIPTHAHISTYKVDQEIEQLIQQEWDWQAGKGNQDEKQPTREYRNMELTLQSNMGIQIDRTIKEKMKEVDRRDASYTVQKHRNRMQRLADNRQKVGNKIMTGQFTQSNRYALRILKDGDRILTQPNQILQKCYTSLQQHHQVPPPAPPAETYPWENPGSVDQFKLETETHQAVCMQGMHRMIQDKAEYYRAINTLSSGKQPGPDNIPNEIIKAAPALLKDCLYMLLQVMWATGSTPDRWKESYTILIFKNKGTILELDYYRRIGLENTLYKCWTKIVQGVFAAYAEKHHILSQEQGGFRAHRNTIQQLETHTMLLEDARLTEQDIFLVMVDLKEAFDTIDHHRMIKVIRDLGYPEDAIQVVQGLYENASTKVTTPYGHTPAIQIQRGTLQGDSLSPFLFILYLEPLLRWLTVGARGYHPGVLRTLSPGTHFTNTAYADDLSVYTGSQSDLHVQLDKVSAYCTWAGLIISHQKTLATAALYKRLPRKPMDFATVQRILASIRMQNQKVQIHDPRQPYKLLGLWYTMDLKWTKQLLETRAALKDMAAHLHRSYNTQTQKLRTLQTCLAAKARYAFPLMCYSAQDIEKLDKTLDQVVRHAYRLPPGTPTAFLREDLKKGGLGHTSLTVAYTTTAVKNLTQAYAEEGKRGQLTRAILAAQHKAFTHPTAQPLKGWIPDYSLRLRQLIQGHKADIHMWMQGSQPYELPDNEIIQTIMGVTDGGDIPHHRLQRLKKPLQNLWEIGVHSLSQLLNKNGNRMLTPQELARNLSLEQGLPPAGKHHRALKAVAEYLRAVPHGHSPQDKAEMGQVHACHQQWVRNTLRKEREHQPLPPSVLELITTAPRCTVPGVHLNCGGKRKHKLIVDPEFRDTDMTQYENPRDVDLHIRDTHQEPELGTKEQESSPPQQDCRGQPNPLTRHERAMRMLVQKSKPVEIYNQLCAYKDQVAEVSGEWRLRTKHNRQPLRKRQLLRKQMQWKVHWKPTILEGWEKDIATNNLKYTPRCMRLASVEEIRAHLPPICEHCHEAKQTVRCRECHRGYHPCCQPLTPDTGKCSQCYKSESWRSAPRLAKYREAVQHWYIEWEPQWEDEHELRLLGYGEVVETTMKEMKQQATAQPVSRPPRDAHLPNLERQGNSGPRYNSTVGDPLREKCTFITEDTDPHTDIVGTGQYEIQIRPILRRYTLQTGTKIDSTQEMVTVHDPSGRTVGMITPDRASILYRNYLQVLRERLETVRELEPQSFAEELARLLLRYRNGTRIPGSQKRVDLTNHWTTPPGIYQALQKHLPQMNKERFASPLNYNPGMKWYWSCFKRDQIFGALHDAYSCKWTGLSVANPEYDSKELYKAVSWAVHSSQTTTHPTLTAFVLPAWKGGSNTAYLKWTQKRPDLCRLLTTVPRRSFKFVPPETNTLGLKADDVGHPKWDVNILLVGNKAGYCNSLGKEETTKLKLAIIEAINQHTQNDPPLSWSQLTHYPPPDTDSGEISYSTQQLDPILYRPSARVKDLPEDQESQWAVSSQSDLESETEQSGAPVSTQNFPLKHNWTDFAYTDGSQKKLAIAGTGGEEITVIGSGVYVPAQNDKQEQKIRIRAMSPGHNTAYRAELIGILGALQQGYHQILTDSVNSIHAIRATLYHPAKIRFHRHRHLLEQIKATILAAEGHIRIMKVRAHAGIPGNEWADDLAAQAAVLDRADLDLSEIDSNTRTQGMWPAQQTWEDHPIKGEQQRWRMVENLDEALHNRVQQTANLRLGMANTQTIYYSAMQRSLPDIAEQYMDTWHRTTGITEGMKNIRAKYLTGQLPTAKNLQRYKVKRTPICPCCKKHPDGGHHAVAWCPSIQGMVQDKHNEAVRIITQAIAEGDKGAHQIAYNDGGAPHKWIHSGAGDLYRSIRDIPDELISQEELRQCGSRPDIILYRKQQTKRRGSRYSTARPAEITVIEIKYVRDTDPTTNAKDPHAQHRTLYNALREKHPTAELRKIILLLGVAGTVYTQHTLRELDRVGVRGQHQKKTVIKLQKAAIKALHATWQQRMKIISNSHQQGVKTPPTQSCTCPKGCPKNPSRPEGRRNIRGGDHRDVGGGRHDDMG